MRAVAPGVQRLIAELPVALELGRSSHAVALLAGPEYAHARALLGPASKAAPPEAAVPSGAAAAGMTSPSPIRFTIS